jgi:hypothetical protein
MGTTRCVMQQLLRKRPNIDMQWCDAVSADPLRREVQTDGRVRLWGEAARRREPTPGVPRPVTPGDGVTIDTAFFYRGFRKETP